MITPTFEPSHELRRIFPPSSPGCGTHGTPAKAAEESPLEHFLKDDKGAPLHVKNGPPDLPKDGFEKLDDLRNFYEQKIEGIPGSGGGIEEIPVGDHRYWLCRRSILSGHVLEECAVFCQKDGRFKALLSTPFQHNQLKISHDGPVISISAFDKDFNMDMEIVRLDLEAASPASK